MCKPSIYDEEEQQQERQQQQQNGSAAPLLSRFPKDSTTTSTATNPDGDHSGRRRRESNIIELRMTKNLVQRSGLAFFACLQNALVGGLVFGWASIDRTLLVATTETGGAGLHPTETTLIFSWASCIAMVSSLLMGAILDKFGPKKASVVSNVFVLVGCQLFAIATTFRCFAIATCFMAFGGPGISSSIVHIANLFPKNQFLIMSCLCGSITFSFSILAIFGDLWEIYGIGFRPLFGGYVVVIAASTIGSFLVWPDTPFEKEDSDEYYNLDSQDDNDADDDDYEEEEPPLQQQRQQQHFIAPEQEYVEATLCHHQLLEQPLDSGLRQNLTYGRTASYYQSAKAIQNGNVSAISLKDQPFWNQIFSQTYLRNLIIFVTTSFFVNFTIASITTELADQQIFSLEVQHDLSRSFTLIMSGGLVGSILVGWLMDRVGLEACTILTLLLGQTSLALRIVSQSYSIMLVAYVVYTLFRQFLFPVFIACLTGRLGFKYFGILSGVGFALSGIAQVFMASLVHLLQGDCHLQDESVYGNTAAPCNHGDWISFHVLQMALLAILTILPIMDWHKEATKQRHRRQKQQQLLLQSSSSSRSAESKTIKATNTFDTQEDTTTTPPPDKRESSSNSSWVSVGPAPPTGLLGHAFAAASYGAV